jgi:CRISPR-associated helicase Cas3/CRISPR-associated endonuclease Cas3-HD
VHYLAMTAAAPETALSYVPWAKSQRNEYGELIGWLPLAQHLADSAAVARKLWATWLAPSIRRLVAADVGDETAAESVFVSLTWLHDIGKATPAFTAKDPELRLRAVRAGLTAPPMVPHAHLLPHGLAGFLIVQRALEQRLGLDRAASRTLAVIIGGHHGVPPSDDQIRQARSLHQAMGDGDWDVARQWLMAPPLQRLEELLGAGAQLRLSRPVQVLLSGAVIMADWIASSSDHFTLFPPGWRPPHRYDPVLAAGDRCAAAWRALSFPSCWHGAPLPTNWQSTFAQRFGLPEGAGPNATQTATVEMVSTAPGPGLLVIEAPMGVGKTEAALLATEVLAPVCGSGGAMIALPTRATSDAMFTRVARWLSTQIDDREVPVYLAHGKASLNDDFRRLPRMRLASVGIDSYGEARPVREAGLEDGRVVAYEWMSGRKRGSLSSFVVGTVDQLLFMGLKARHLALRHLAMSGKVVVVDEVHSYDAFMGSYLQTALRWLAAYRVPVVLLSATLAPSTRRCLLEAYTPTRAPVTGRRSFRREVAAHSAGAEPAGYPRLEWRGLDGGAVVRTAEPPPTTDVALERLGSSGGELVAFLVDRLRHGGCALVIRNTVREVQQTAVHLSSVFGEDVVSAAHSRFIATDRAAIDRGLIQRFGPDGERPQLAIVVASQVAEQSLDVDFDLLISDVAPIDLLLQRVGRLHRHAGRSRPGPLASPVLGMGGVEDWAAQVPQIVGGTRRVYSEWVLLRTLAVLQGRTRIRLPQDVPALVSQVYDGEPLAPGIWSDAESVAKADHDQRVLDQLARAGQFQIGSPAASPDLIGWLAASIGEADDSVRGRAQVRDSAESLEVIALHRRSDGSVGLMPWMDELPIDLAGPVPVEFPVDRRVAMSTLALPAHLSTMAVIDELEPLMPPAFQNSMWLKGELVLLFEPDCSARIGGRRLRYSYRYGLQEVADERTPS